MTKAIPSLLCLLLAALVSAAPGAPDSRAVRLEPKAMPTKLAAGERETRPGGLVEGVASGGLRVLRLAGREAAGELALPLEHTDVAIRVSGFVARAEVTQRFGNPYDQPIEAVYTFPLPEDAAVDAMTMRIGERTIKGTIERREEARRIYEEAKEKGQRAALLDQERPNVFTQAVANIMPGDRIEIVIAYVDLLTYRDGGYELVFPLVVGPRYLPGKPRGSSGTGIAPDTDRVPDASRISPPVLPPETRSGHDIALSVELDAGVPIRGLYSTSHALDVWDLTPHRRWIELAPAENLANKDFVLRYRTAGESLQTSSLSHRDERGGFFTLTFEPQLRVEDDETVPRELIFIVDTSGSMSGFPIEKSKEAMRRLIHGMRPSDRFNIVRFAGDTGTLWSQSRQVSEERLAEAIAFVEGFRGGGGTEMAKGIVEALTQPAAEGYLRIAILLTDGYVDAGEVLRSVNEERRGARIFTLGVGSAPNRHLLDRAALLGRGEAFYVRQDEESREVIDSFYRRVDRPALANIEIDWRGLEVEEVYPQRIPDLFAGQPLRISGRYREGAAATIEVRGQLGAQAWAQQITVELTDEPGHEVMASIWARRKIKDRMLRRVTEEREGERWENEITQLGLDFKLLSEFTSFVAVEEKVVNQGGRQVTVVQPVEMPEGVSYQGVFGVLGSSMSGGSVGSVFGVGGLGTTGRGGGGGGGGVAYGRGSASLGGRRAVKVPAVRMASPMVMASMPRSAIQKVLNAHKGKIRYCYETALRRDPSLNGKIVVAFIIGADGSVIKVQIEQSTINDAELEKRLLKVIKRLRFPAPPGGGTVEVRHPFVFRPG